MNFYNKNKKSVVTRWIPVFLSNCTIGKTNLFLMSLALFISYFIVRRILLKSISDAYQEKEGKEYPNSRSKRQSILSIIETESQKEFLANLVSCIILLAVSLLYSSRFGKFGSLGMNPFNLEAKVLTLYDQDNDSPNSDNSSSNLSFELKEKEDETEDQNEDGWLNSDNSSSNFDEEKDETEEKTEEAFSETKNQNSENSDSNGYSKKALVWKYFTKISAIAVIYVITNKIHVAIDSDASGLNSFINHIALKEIKYFKDENNALQTSINHYREILQMNSTIVESGTPPETPLEIIESMNEEAEFFIEDSEDQINKNLEKIRTIETKMLKTQNIVGKSIKILTSLINIIISYYVVKS